ncbi:hypothetical protein LOD99_474 [Oopsacas minuta]|uniref:Sec16 Sec23-binding domain-containing protein n=1 Tax=Oopsacas minuta TaxID=111878 RepID=A0AAV7KAK5_9METZ|nr:hypothetical protein LOD99_474 [Oopsacas minuta]
MNSQDNEVNFFNSDFDNSIANSFTANDSGGADALQSASFLFSDSDNPNIPPSHSTSSIPVTRVKLLDPPKIPPTNSLPFLPPHAHPARLPPITHPWTSYPPNESKSQNGDYLPPVSDGHNTGVELEGCDPIEQEYLLEAKREQETSILSDTATDLINLDYSFKSEELKERVTGIKLAGNTSSSNTPNSSSSSGIKTPGLLPASIPTLSPDTGTRLPPSHIGQVDLSHSHETICNEPAYSGGEAVENRSADPSLQHTHNSNLTRDKQSSYQHNYNTHEQNYTPHYPSEVQQHSTSTHGSQVIIPTNSQLEIESYNASTKANTYALEHSNLPPVVTSTQQHYSLLHTQSNPLSTRANQQQRDISPQLNTLLTEQKYNMTMKRFPTPSNSAFVKPAPSSSMFHPLNPPSKNMPAPLPVMDRNDLEVQQMYSNGRVSRSELSIGASDDGLPRCRSALEPRFTPAPPSKQRKKIKSSSKRHVSNIPDTGDTGTGSDQDRQNSSGGTHHVTRTSSYTSLAPQHVSRPSSRTSEPARRSRASRPFSAVPKPPQITTDLPVSTSDPPKTSPPPVTNTLPDAAVYTSEQRHRELPPVPDTHTHRYLPQPPKPYTDPNLTMPANPEYPYPPYGYPPMQRWPAPGPAPKEEDPTVGYPPQGYFPYYNPYQYQYPYMFYPPYVPNGEAGEDQQIVPPGYPPYPFPYYPMNPHMYPYMSHPGSRMGSYAPSLADDTTEIGSIYSAGAEEQHQEQLQQEPQHPLESSFLLEKLSAQHISFGYVNQSSTPVPDLETQRNTPLLFDYPHVKATFSSNGALLLTPYNSVSGVKIRKLHEVCQLPLLAKHDSFPGPLNSLSVKSEVVRFTKEHVTASQTIGDTDNALMWEYLSRLCAQNGVLVTSDVVELLTQGGSFNTRQIEGQNQLESREVGEKLRQLVLQRRIKEAVEFCTEQKLWTHALLLAQTLDEHTRASVQDRFTYSLHASDPLQCYYSAVVGKRPHGVHAFYLREGHNWKQHLAMLISHRNLPASETSISSLADNLAECSHTNAAHLVRLLQGYPLGGWGDKESKYSLLGVEGSGFHLGSRCVGPEELHKTEVYEYARSLSNSEFSLQGFQPFKYRIAVLYAEAGLLQKAFSYCEAIFASVQKQPYSYSIGFLSHLLSLSDLLHGSLIQLPSTPLHDPPHYPRWISMISSYIEQQQGGGIYVPTPSIPLLTPTPSLMSPYPDSKQLSIIPNRQFGVNPVSGPAYAHPQATQSQVNVLPDAVAFSTPEASMFREGFGVVEDDEATTESYKSAGDESLMGGGGHNTDEEVDFDIPSLDSSPLPPGIISTPQSPSDSINRPFTGSADNGGQTGGSSWVGNIVGRFRSKSLNKNQMRLPTKSDRFFYDYDKGMWIDKIGGEQESAAPISPPKDIDLAPLSIPGTLPPTEPQGIMSFNTRSRYVDIMNTTGPKSSMAPPAPLFPTNFDSPFSGTLFMPQAQPDALTVSRARVSPDTVSVTTASISEASKEVRQIMQNKQPVPHPLPPGVRY